jgi:hypothetical protein
MKNQLLVSAFVALALLFCVYVGYTFTKTWFAPLKFAPECHDSFRTYHLAIGEERGDYYECAKERAKLFLSHDYAEAKDLAKAFLVLLTGVLVASITFSEKIVNISSSGRWSRGLMICSWVLLFIAIAACGAGLAFMSYGAGYAVYFPFQDYRQLEVKAMRLFISAGLSFGCGLVSLLVAGIVSLIERSRENKPGKLQQFEV